MQAAPGHGQPRKQADMADDIPYQEGCEECAHWMRAEESAREARNLSREVDARVMGRRHLRTTHDVVSLVRS